MRFAKCVGGGATENCFNSSGRCATKANAGAKRRHGRKREITTHSLRGKYLSAAAFFNTKHIMRAAAAVIISAERGSGAENVLIKARQERRWKLY